MNDKLVYQVIAPFPILKQYITAFQIKLLRDLGKNEYSAIFMAVMEALIENNHLKKIEIFYQKSLTSVSSRMSTAQSYQNHLKSFFTNGKVITFQSFLQKQKQIDPNNQVSGEFLKSFFIERYKVISVPSVMAYFQKNFDLQVLSVSQQELNYFKSKYLSSSVIVYQATESQRFYYLIADQQQEQLSQSIVMKKQCVQCNKAVDQYYPDGKTHAHCIDCICKKFYDDKLIVFFCPIASCSIQKYDFEQYAQKNNFDLGKYQQKIKIKSCSKCYRPSVDNEYFQNTCKHIYCRECSEKLQQLSMCMALECTTSLDKYQLGKFLKSRQDLMASSQRMVQEVKKTEEYPSNLNVSRKQPEQQASSTLQQLNFSKCENCYKEFNIKFLYINYCGHQYCQICTNKFLERGVSQLKCVGLRCQEKVNVQELDMFFQELLQQQYKDKLLICSICKYKQESQKDLYKISKCQHLVCFSCINQQQMSTKQSWLTALRCPDRYCVSYIDIDDLDDYFTTRQQEKLVELDPQLEQKQNQEPSPQDKLEQSNKIEESKKSQNEEKPAEEQQAEEKQAEEKIAEKSLNQSQINQQQKKTIKLNRINAMKGKVNGEQKQVEESKDLESIEEPELQKQIEIPTGQCSMCGEDYTLYNTQIKMECKFDHSIGVCCFLSKYKKCMVCEKNTPYECVKFEVFSSKFSGIYSQKLTQSSYYGNSYGSNFGQSYNTNYRTKDDYRPSSNSQAFRNSSQMPMVRRY